MLVFVLLLLLLIAQGTPVLHNTQPSQDQLQIIVDTSWVYDPSRVREDQQKLRRELIADESFRYILNDTSVAEYALDENRYFRNTYLGYNRNDCDYLLHLFREAEGDLYWRYPFLRAYRVKCGTKRLFD
ncbi:hypothetical protein OESDEN_06908 [Oesophagostomum dentatum]|uniref:Uncharacterized protein n=1 Tax=Oesophagostomum dentatum TaxID=61180 RepID=A0A0B1TAQ1_OESDE|nr:hypothetical protein OESDEN_06908 [Oesophagostomum dentatum]